MKVLIGGARGNDLIVNMMNCKKIHKKMDAKNQLEKLYCQPGILILSMFLLLMKRNLEIFKKCWATRRDLWKKATEEKMSSLRKNNTYDLLELSKGKRALKNKWVFKLKRDDKKIIKHKAHLVLKGFSWKKCVNFDKIFSLVVKISSIHVILLVASMDLEIEQLDVKTALHGDLEEEIYMEQPELFQVKGREHLACKLKKSLYGLK